ncbi:MAG: NAD(P)/FAD-dependent oxidoreductase [Legionellaceae bacterium]|nr:NAD(P)/FAD-dependent oxidoreductase [Legionellaceae bacterium]
MNRYDVVIIGAGAAGLMCAIEAGKRGRSVLVLDKANKVGKKILMSGGGRCNFTNYEVSPDKYLSHNPHFCKSALSRYTPWDFIALVEKHQIPYYEKTLGQLFCCHKASDIVQMLLAECEAAGVTIRLNQAIQSVHAMPRGFKLALPNSSCYGDALVVACGGLSIPSMGASPFGYQLAEQFGLPVYPTRAGLVPFTLHAPDKARFSDLSGVAVDCEVSCRQQSFREAMLFTHRGLSGPAMLQISSYWQPGEELTIRLLPDLDLPALLQQQQAEQAEQQVKTLLSRYFPKRLLAVFLAADVLEKPLKRLSSTEQIMLAATLQHWHIKPNNTEGYRTAEVTLGGVDCNAVSSQTFECHRQPGLYFIGEVLDVTGWLGGYNFQWAWASGWAAGQVV